MGNGQAARVRGDGLDLPGYPGGALGLHGRAPERDHALDEPARRVDLEVHALAEGSGGVRSAHLVARAGRPVRGLAGAEVVLAPDLGIGDRLPEALRGRLDIDLEHLLHGTLQSALEG